MLRQRVRLERGLEVRGDQVDREPGGGGALARHRRHLEVRLERGHVQAPLREHQRRPACAGADLERAVTGVGVGVG